MILKSSASPIIPVPQKEISCVMFEDSGHLRNFIQSTQLFMKGRSKSENEFFYLMDDDYQELPKKNFYPILLDCGKLDLSLEKSFKDGTLSYFEKMIYENMEINQYFHQLQVSIDNLANRLELSKGGYTLEVQSQTFNVKNLLKLMNIDLHHNGSEISHMNLRECFTDILRDLNVDNKEEILIILFPETNLGTKDIVKFMKWLHKKNITSLVITNSLSIMQNVKFNNVNMVKENKQLYDTVTLANELEIFEMKDEKHWDKQVIQLSYLDFTEENILVNEKYNSFLN